jgi:hypothetical protein
VRQGAICPFCTEPTVIGGGGAEKAKQAIGKHLRDVHRDVAEVDKLNFIRKLRLSLFESLRVTMAGKVDKFYYNPKLQKGQKRL